MKRFNKRISKLEQVAKTKYNHYGVFFILKQNGKLILRHYQDEDREFNTMEELEFHACTHYECEKYQFINLADIFDYLDKNKKIAREIDHKTMKLEDLVIK